MQMSFNSRVRAEGRFKSIYGRRTLGGFDLMLTLEVSVPANERPTDAIAIEHWTASVNCGRTGAPLKPLGWAWQQSPTRVHWWLLATAGKGRVWEYEQLKEIQKVRIQIAGGYELVHDGRTWSWKYLESHVQSLRTSIRLAIAHKQDERLQSLIADVYATAGFRLARQQAGHLAAFIRADWIRVRGAGEAMPAFPTRMLYVRALANEGTVTGAVSGKPAKDRKPSKPAAPVVVSLPVDSEPRGGVDRPEPTSQAGPARDGVVSAEATWFESDWLAGLVAGEGEPSRDA